MVQKAYSLEPVEEVDINLAERFGAPESDVESAPVAAEKESTPRVEGSVEKSSAERDSSYSKILNDVQATPPHDDAIADVSQDASEAHQKMDYESQLQHLVDLAMTKGVVHAVQVAEHLNDYYMLDRLHDALVHDDLHEKLTERGML